MSWVMLLLPLALLALGFPIFMILIATSITVIFFYMDVPSVVAHQVMFGSVDKLALLAAPFFIFAGELMTQGGLSRRITDWVQSLVGGIRGSLGITAVASCAFFGAMSGSGAATTAAIGQVLYRPLMRQGYDPRFSAGVLVSSGGLAVIIPPSIAMILYAASAEQSVVKLFMAGFGPGIMLALMMAFYVYVYAVRARVPTTGRFRWSVFVAATRAGWLALLTPAIILGGIYSGVFDPTEAGAVSCIYAALVTRYAYRDIDWWGIWHAAVRTAYVCAQLFIIIAAAGLYSWLLTISGVPQALVAVIEHLNAPPWVVLLAINVFLLLVGCLIDPTSAIIILTPLLLPMVKAAGIDLIHFGIIMTLNLEIGMFTPPFGLNIFVGQSVLKAPLSDIYRGTVPFIIINLIALMITTYVPDISLWLVRVLT
ncbi:MAG: TRAP transporter large permease [Alphaproteobacteria bacterium]|nr:TRAP transporter large permease [Alphaproteobacteria bacterium]